VEVPLLPGSQPRWLTANSHQIPTLLTAVLGLTRNGSLSLLYGLSTDRIENTASDSYSIVVCYTAVTKQWLFLWFLSSYCEQIRHSVLEFLLLFIKLTKFVLNEVTQVQRIIQNAVILFYKLTGNIKSELTYRVLTMVYNTQNYWGFGLYPSSGF
jgi:hypothetical protein